MHLEMLSSTNEHENTRNNYQRNDLKYA